MEKYAEQALKFQMRRRKFISIFCEKMVVKIVKKMLFSLSVSVALAEYSVLAEYSAEYTAKTFGRSHFRSDTMTLLSVALFYEYGAKHGDSILDLRF
jgi:hypothetical protein